MIQLKHAIYSTTCKSQTNGELIFETSILCFMKFLRHLLSSCTYRQHFKLSQINCAEIIHNNIANNSGRSNIIFPEINSLHLVGNSSTIDVPLELNSAFLS